VPSSCLPWLIEASSLVALFLLYAASQCTASASCLLPPFPLSLSPASCCITSNCADSALHHLLLRHPLSLMHRLVVALPLSCHLYLVSALITLPPFAMRPLIVMLPLIMPPSSMLICIWGIPVCKWGFKYAYSNPYLQMGNRQMLHLCMKMGIDICIQGSPHAYRDSFLNEGDHLMHMAIPICIRG
jgi:hypothetical protein